VTILAIDTTSSLGSIALRRNGHTTLIREITSPDGFAHVIFPSIEELLAEAGCRLGDIDCFAAGSGPGSFTGVRVGLSVVKGLAEAEGKKAVGISNLRALASFGKSDRRAVYLNARRGEIYGAVYDENLQIVIPEQVFKNLDWIPAGAEIIRAEDHRSLAGAIAACAEMELLKNPDGDPAGLDANYVRRSDAELFWKDDGF